MRIIDCLHGTRASPENRNRLQVRQGIAILSVMLIIVILSIATVPMLELVRQAKERSLKQQVVALLNKEAKEYLEIGIYTLQLANSFPPNGFTTDQSPEIKKVAQACERRIQTIDPDMLGTASLTDNTTVYNSQVTVADNRRVAQFIVVKTVSSDGFEHYAMVSCATADTGGLGVYGAEIAKTKRSFLTLKFGKF